VIKFLLRSLVASLAVLWFTAHTEEPLRTGDLAPNWILADSKGAPASLYEQAEKGNWTVMVFWASWCANSKTLLPKMETLSQTLDKSATSFYLMNVWEDKVPETYLKEEGLTIPVIRQAERVAKRYDVNITPGVVVVGPDRRIRYLSQPQESADTIAENIQKLIGTSASLGK
jgi:thiol-disulfide isomerase/thioredoxin